MTPAPLSPGSLAQLAAILEVTAGKPGNVNRIHDFADTHFLDFLLSAMAIAPALDRARDESLGTTILAAVTATRGIVAANTNLGMILLFAPLCAVPDGRDLRSGVEAVLRATTIDDAKRMYEAIRLAKPGGLGSVEAQDVANEPTESLVDVMRLAAAHDSIARQYASGYEDVFDHIAPVLDRSLEAGRTLDESIVFAHVSTLAKLPDTLIRRKRGTEEAAEASRRAAEVLDAGWPGEDAGVRHFAELDQWLRAEGNSRNPGTTADLITAALFVALRDGTIQLPIAGRLWSKPTPRV
jgi:triphosphoribosyl-dephospho-CoA synthase